MIKNEEYIGIVEGLGSDGEGIIKIEGAAVFVPFCLVGEEVKFKILKVKGNIAYGKLTEVLSPSPERVKPRCPVFGKCGGCDLQHASYAAQLEFKRGTVKNCLLKIGGITAEVDPAEPCESQYGYRNKISLPIGEEGTGLYARHSHRIVAAESCAIQKDWATAVISAVNGFVNESGDKRFLRHLVVREVQGKFIFALVAAKEVDAKPLIKRLEKSFEEFTFLININDSDTNVIFGKSWRVLRGNGFFKAEEFGITYTAGANTFLQVNDGVRAKLYARVLKEAGGDVAIDLYSGGGLLTAMLAKKCKKAYGIEIVEEASHCADELKRENGLNGRMINICGKVEDEIEKVIAKTAGENRVIVCDPPRKGMERSAVRAIINSGAEKVILISCNPATLARDLGLLTGTLTETGGELVKSGGAQSGAYEILSITPYDMFPQTKHVETLVVLKRKN